jgi:hypothetical protein
VHSSRRLDERARPEIGRNILGHVDIRVTQNVDIKSWWKGFPDEPETRPSKSRALAPINASRTSLTMSALPNYFWRLTRKIRTWTEETSLQSLRTGIML